MDFVENLLEKGKSKEEIKVTPHRKDDLMYFLNDKIEYDEWPEPLDKDIWEAIVDETASYVTNRHDIKDRSCASEIYTGEINNNFSAPTSSKTIWCNYQKKLYDSGYTRAEVAELSDSCLSTLNKLSGKSQNNDPIKGLVVGNVQSGKTSHMAGLIAMAADFGWNYFIILTGSIDSLRVQTQNRLIDDLTYNGLDIKIRTIDNPSSNSSSQDQLANLDLKKDSRERYLSVCLKNHSRLLDLLNWWGKDPNNSKNLKVLVIDDEADQGSLNTSKNDYTTINEDIITIVNGKPRGNNLKGKKKTRPDVFAMNYISYTATPYGNLLNEASKDSLYPRNFIKCLDSSEKYIGAKQIFGSGEDGDTDNNLLNIHRIITETELKEIKKIHNEEFVEDIPNSLKNALVWFLCSIASMRVSRKNAKKVKSFTMLIHTSHKQKDQKNIASVISTWLSNNRENKSSIINLAKKVYKDETSSFKKSDFLNVMTNYDSYFDVNNYYKFEEIKDELVKLIEEGPTQIFFDDDTQNLKFNSGLQICVDNCSNNGLDNNNEHWRLVYPQKTDEVLNNTLAYIVIGGNTLSRGLTLEGLISSYFVRTVKQGDSLFQMGRWFGYRIGYELYPRVWMTRDTFSKFEFLSKLNYELFKELKDLERSDSKPLDYQVKLLDSHRYNWLKTTALNKQQSKKTIEWDFAGKHSQTSIFDGNPENIRKNNESVINFLTSLGESKKSKFEHAKNNYYWENIEISVVEDFLIRFIYSENTQSFDDIQELTKWLNKVIKKNDFNKWTVIAAGTEENNPNGYWTIPYNKKIGKIVRSHSNSDNKNIRIGTLDNKRDLLSAVDTESSENKEEILDLCGKNDGKKIVNNYDKIREVAHKDKDPVLLFYCISKNSESKKGEPSRTLGELTGEQDLFAFSLSIPGIKGSGKIKVTVAVPDEETDSEIEV